jgi:hypothetical protein
VEATAILGLIFLAWLLYRAGFEAGRTHQSRLDTLYSQASGEADPVKRAALLAAWDKLSRS